MIRMQCMRLVGIAGKYRETASAEYWPLQQLSERADHISGKLRYVRLLSIASAWTQWTDQMTAAVPDGIFIETQPATNA